MADPRFFDKSDPCALKTLADIGQCMVDSANHDITINDVAPLHTAGDRDISFFDNAKYKDAFQNTKARACIVSADMVKFAPEGVICLISKSPYKSYALIAQHFYPAPQGEDISDHAIIHDTADIGKNCIIHPGAVIDKNVQIGDHCVIGANAVISHAVIGNHVTIYRGACIGQDGFGFAPDPAGFVKVLQLGRVMIGDHVEIGANTTIDRGAGPDTVIGQGTWIDNLVQIGHNVKIGNGCVIVAQVGISGSTEIDDYTMIGGQVGIAGHLKIGSGVRIAAQSGIMRDIPDGQNVMGSPAMPMRDFMKQTAWLKRMIKSKTTNAHK